MTLAVCCVTNGPVGQVAALLSLLRPIADEIVVAMDRPGPPTTPGPILELADVPTRSSSGPVGAERVLNWLHRACSSRLGDPDRQRRGPVARTSRRACRDARERRRHAAVPDPATLVLPRSAPLARRAAVGAGLAASPRAQRPRTTTRRRAVACGTRAAWSRAGTSSSRSTTSTARSRAWPSASEEGRPLRGAAPRPRHRGRRERERVLPARAARDRGRRSQFPEGTSRSSTRSSTRSARPEEASRHGRREARAGPAARRESPLGVSRGPRECLPGHRSSLARAAAGPAGGRRTSVTVRRVATTGRRSGRSATRSRSSGSRTVGCTATTPTHAAKGRGRASPPTSGRATRSSSR